MSFEESSQSVKKKHVLIPNYSEQKQEARRLFLLTSPGAFHSSFTAKTATRAIISLLPLSFFGSTVFKVDRAPARFAGLPVTFLAMESGIRFRTEQKKNRFCACHCIAGNGSCLKTVSVPTFVLGGMQGSTATSALVHISGNSSHYCNGNPVGFRSQRGDRKIHGRQKMCLDQRLNPGLRN